MNKPPMEILDFPTYTLESIVGGGSPIDVPRLHLETLEQAEEFLGSYGFNWTSPLHKKEILAIQSEAISFIEDEFLKEDPNLTVPDFISSERDLRKVMLWASSKDKEAKQQWSCALLRVMHTFMHSRSYFNQKFDQQIRQQIIQRFEPHLHVGANGPVLGRGEGAIPLIHFEIKRAKPIRSVVMKLLHKAENVATAIFDRVGIRLITGDKLDALMVVRYLRSHNVIMFANIQQPRSKNTLVDMGSFREELARLNESFEAGKIDKAEREQKLRIFLKHQSYPNAQDNVKNRFSDRSYHSIQFTCRQMVRTLEPYTQTLPLADELIDDHDLKELNNDPSEPPRRYKEIRFFFPYEVQIMDLDSYQASKSGLASHDEYKRRQTHVAKRRVLGDLLGINELEQVVAKSLLQREEKSS